MADYNSSYTGAQVDAAVAKANSPDTTPTNNSSALITSGGVYTYVDSICGDINTALAAILGE